MNTVKEKKQADPLMQQPLMSKFRSVFVTKEDLDKSSGRRNSERKSKEDSFDKSQIVSNKSPNIILNGSLRNSFVLGQHNKEPDSLS